MPEYRFHGAADSLQLLVNDLWNDGEIVSPRGIKTQELRHVVIIIEQPHDCLMVGVGRSWNSRLAALEALQLISGRQYPQLMWRVAPQTSQFLDGGTFHGAYGPRLRHQLRDALLRLKLDRDTRQAVSTIWDPTYDGHNDTGDTPCTVYVNFMIRNDKLIMHTHMRSNDVMWGWCYDVTQFCALQVHVAQSLGLSCGEYVHFVDSFHLYVERDHELIYKITKPEKSFPQRDYLRPISSIVSWDVQVARARELLDGKMEEPRSDISWLDTQAWRIHEQA